MAIAARISIVVISYFGATLIAILGFFALLAAVNLVGSTALSREIFFFAWIGRSISELIISLWLLVCIGAFFPASVFLAYTESAAERRLLAYLLGGAAIAGLFAAIAIISKPDDPALITWATGIVAGSFGGAAYWLLAGRYSNNWRISFLTKR